MLDNHRRQPNTKKTFSYTGMMQNGLSLDTDYILWKSNL